MYYLRMVGMLLFFIIFEVQSHTEMSKKASGHGPGSVMSEHMHVANEWMLGYRFEYTAYGTIASGREKLERNAVLGKGYSMVATSMDMQMHMLDIMYAPTDIFTLMLMPHYMIMDMKMFGKKGSMSHTVKGVGDTKFGGLLRLYEDENWGNYLSLMLSFPTGSINKKTNSGILTHYDMQMGSGTYDLEPTYTIRIRQGDWGFGAQLGGVVRLQSFNSNGYRLGSKIFSNLWTSYDFSQKFSVSTRVQWKKQGAIRGQYNKPHTMMSPPDFPENYGGKLAELGFGVNWLIPMDIMSTWNFSIEWTLPFYQSINGIQLRKKYALNCNVSTSF